MPKFTQGKWHADDFYSYIFNDDKSMMIAQIRGWGCLTGKGAGGLGLSDEEAYEIQKANARLIASAPEMYEELCEALEFFKKEEFYSDEAKTYIKSIEELLARIDGEEDNEV